MTVAEVIESLRSVPQEMEAVIRDEQGDFIPIKKGAIVATRLVKMPVKNAYQWNPKGTKKKVTFI